MFFEKEIICFNILDVIEVKQKNVNLFNSGRNFSALSFRIKANTVLKTDTKEYTMTDNSIAYVPARLDYTRISSEDELIVVHFDSMNYQSKEIEVFDSENSEKLESLFRQLLNFWREREIGYKYKCSALLYQIFAECYEQNFKPRESTSKIQSAVDYIQANYKNVELRIGDAARRAFMSEVYFRKLFKEEYRISPQKYVVNLRIQNSVGLISTGYYSLKEVALMSGYRDYKYFSVEFKRVMGISPSEYYYNYKK